MGDFQGTNCAGKTYSNGLFGDHYKSWEWGIMSGLLEITSGDTSTGFAIDVRTPGGWMDAADGPNLMGDGSEMSYVFLHHADDTVKLSASHVTVREVVALQGNVGSAVFLGNYGLGLRNGVVRSCIVDGVYLNRIVHAYGGYDGHGGVFGTRTCPNGISFEDISVKNLVIPDINSANSVDQLFSIGVLAGSAVFCSGQNGPVTFNSISFENWDVYVNPSMYSVFFNDGNSNSNADSINFYDVSASGQADILASAVRIWSSSSFYYCVCGTSTNADQCWNMNGAGSGVQNTVYQGLGVTNINFPYGYYRQPLKFIFA